MLTTPIPTDLVLAAREFIDRVTDADPDWRWNYYAQFSKDDEQNDPDWMLPCNNPRQECGRCQPCLVLAFWAEAGKLSGKDA